MPAANLWLAFKQLFTVDDRVLEETFSLRDATAQRKAAAPGRHEGPPRPMSFTELEATAAGRAIGALQRGFSQAWSSRVHADALRATLTEIQDRAHEVLRRTEATLTRLRPLATARAPLPTGEPGPPAPPGDRIPRDLDEAKLRMENIFHLPKNNDVIRRELLIPLDPPVRAFLVFLEGMAGSKLIHEGIIQPLLLLPRLAHRAPYALGTTIEKSLLVGNQVERKATLSEAAFAVTTGMTALFVDGLDAAFIIETKGYDFRSIERPQNEVVLRGPQEAFVEKLRTNTAQIRRFLRTPDLITELYQVGRRGRRDVALMYIEGLANPELVDAVRRRVRAIDVDVITDGQLEQFLEDSPAGLLPTTLVTERPDRTAAFLSEGHVAIVSDLNPNALIVPATIWSAFHSAEDYYLRHPFGNFLRLLRGVSLFIALALPGIYVAIVNYHPEMIPTDLLLSIAGQRELVPFPAVMELVFLELTFELIREAGVRIPTVIGPTIGIVGALILGQAAVQAGLISAIVVIMIAITGIASFAIPSIDLAFSVRLLRFGFIALAAVLGFFGVAAGLIALNFYTAGLQSFGVPVLSPVAPWRPPSRDVLVRGQVFDQELRPQELVPKDLRRQPDLVRTWDPAARQRRRLRDLDAMAGGVEDRE